MNPTEDIAHAEKKSRQIYGSESERIRHTYTTLLTQNSEDIKVVQELLRHANSRVTLDLCAQAGMQEKREAQSKLVRLVLNKGEALA